MNSATNFTPNEIVFSNNNSKATKLLQHVHDNLLKAQQSRNTTTNKKKGLPDLSIGDQVWKLLESVHKMDPNWSKSAYYIIKGPFDGNHYLIKTPMGKPTRVSRDQIKKAPIEQPDNDLLSLDDFLQESINLDRNKWEKFKTTTKGKQWTSNSKYALKNLQLLLPSKFRKLDCSSLLQFYQHKDTYKSLQDKLSLLSKFIKDEVYRNHLLQC